MPTLTDPKVALGIGKLIELGVLSESGLREFGNLVQSLQSLGSGPLSSTTVPRRRGNGRRRKFDVSGSELKSLYASHTLKEIAAMYGVSTGTVVNHLQKHGISKPKAAGKRVTKKTSEKSKRKTSAKKAKKTSTRRTTKKAKKRTGKKAKKR